MGFSRQGYWSGLPCPSPGALPNPGIKPTSLMSPALAGRFFTTSATWDTLSGWKCRSPAEEPSQGYWSGLTRRNMRQQSEGPSAWGCPQGTGSQGAPSPMRKGGEWESDRKWEEDQESEGPWKAARGLWRRQAERAGGPAILPLMWESGPQCW